MSSDTDAIIRAVGELIRDREKSMLVTIRALIAEEIAKSKLAKDNALESVVRPLITAVNKQSSILAMIASKEAPKIDLPTVNVKMDPPPKRAFVVKHSDGTSSNIKET